MQAGDGATNIAEALGQQHGGGFLGHFLESGNVLLCDAQADRFLAAVFFHGRSNLAQTFTGGGGDQLDLLGAPFRFCDVGFDQTRIACTGNLCGFFKRL